MADRVAVAVGCPVRNRAWVLPRYLKALSALAYPAGLLRFGFIVNDCIDATESMLRAWEAKPHVEVLNLGHSSWRRESGYSLQNLALLRNRLVEWALSTDARYLFSVDSDIMVPPDALDRLIADEKPFVSMLVCNTPSPVQPASWGARARRPIRPAYNVMYRDERGELRHFYDQYPSADLFEVDVTGAACLIERRIMEAGVRYSYHPFGEDVPFCLEAKARGFSLWCDSRVIGRHLMRETE